MIMTPGHYPENPDPLRAEPEVQQDPQASSPWEQPAPQAQQTPVESSWNSEVFRTQPSVPPVPPQQAAVQPVPPQPTGFDFASHPHAGPAVERRNNKTTLIILGAVLGVITVVVVAATVLFNLDRTFALRGTFVLSDSSYSSFGSPSMSSHDDGSCSGTGGYSDIAEGASVQVYDAAGKVLAVGTLGPSTGGGLVCAFEVLVPEVPAGEDLYQVEVTHRGKVTVTAEEAKAGEVALSLGN